MNAPDRAVRERTLEPSRSFILEAPAGSGKTDLLTARFLTLLATVHSPRQILALTYTRKAADEMQARLLGVLRRARAGAAPKHDWDAFLLERARLALANPAFGEGVLENPEAYRVGTFHSFCASLVRGWPLEAGIPPGAPVLEDMDQAEALEEAVAAAFARAVSGADAALTAAFERRLGALNNRPDRLAEEVVSLLAGRDRLHLFEEARVAAQGDLPAKVRALLSEWVAKRLQPLAGHFNDHRTQYAELRQALVRGGGTFGEVLPEEPPGTGLCDLCGWKALSGVFLKKSGGAWAMFPKEKFGPGFKGSAAALFLQSLPAREAALLEALRVWPEADDDLAGLDSLSDILVLAATAAGDLQTLIPGRGLDYLELEQAALRALLWGGGVPGQSLIFFQEHLRHILVDEAQDMNDLQSLLLSRLVEGWEPGDGRTLFVVGDPKQSIYRFRRADVALFTSLRRGGLPREGEAAYPLERLDLTANFRSEPRLVEFCNALFAAVMAHPDADLDEVVFGASEAARGASPEPAPVSIACFAKPARGAEEDEAEPAEGGAEPLSPREREAEFVAGRIAALCAAEPSATVGLLFPARTALGPHLRALATRGVPLKLLEGEELAARPSVRHLRSLFSALARPIDDLAWAASLRAPWCRLSAQELLALSREPGRFWSEKILAAAGGGAPWSSFAAAATAALDAFGREPHGATVGRLWETLGGPGATASYYGAQGVADARLFLDLLSAGPPLPAEEALARLDRRLSRAWTPPDPRGAFSPVQLMTIHKAKGLEFDHLFAVNLDRDPLGGSVGERPPFRMARIPIPGRPLLAAASADVRDGVHNLAFCLLTELDRGRGLAESRRLFYVAATRARLSLTLTGTVRRLKAGGISHLRKTSPMARLWDAAVVDGDDGPLLTPAFVKRGGLLLLDPECEALPVGAPPPRELPPAPPFEAEPLPYRITSPSEVDEETAQAAPFRVDEVKDPAARARGTVLHRLFETLALGGELPGVGSVAAALAGEGISPPRAGEIAAGLREETRSAWDAPEFQQLLSQATTLRPEWGLEEPEEGGALRVGRFDLFLETPAGPVVVDYKTGRPGGDLRAWLAEEQRVYRGQMNAYREMGAAWSGKPARVFLYFTALPRLVEV